MQWLEFLEYLMESNVMRLIMDIERELVLS